MTPPRFIWLTGANTKQRMLINASFIQCIRREGEGGEAHTRVVLLGGDDRLKVSESLDEIFRLCNS